MHNILSTKLFIFSAAYVTCGLSVDFVFFILLGVFLEYILRLITAGLTFNYRGYPNEVSNKKINFFRWVSTVIVCVFLTILVKAGILF
tara:strand:+ start:311 stop:574 length:264 start_codon:yes stop_codon:yes gene_type:complete